MTFEKFLSEICTLLQEEGISVREDVLRKNNGVSQVSLIIGEGKVAPCIYPEEIYKAMKNGDFKDLNDVMVYLKQMLDTKPNVDFDIDSFSNWEVMKNKLGIRLIHAEKNKELLSEIPHRRYLDLAIVYDVIISGNDGTQGRIRINNEHMKLWKITEDELYFYASSANSDYEVMSMLEALGIDESCMGEGDFPMYVISNQRKMYGASALACKKFMLEEVKKYVGDKYYVLPSSIHELIVIPDSEDMSASALKRMVQEVNETQVPCQEILSDSVYYFDGIQIEIAA